MIEESGRSTPAPEQVPSFWHNPTGMQKLGIFVYVVLCGIPALEINGFGFGLPISDSLALLLSTIGGGVAGGLVCPRPLLAGVVGGLIAGPLGFLVTYLYTQKRHSVWNLELVFVQGLACLPGWGIGFLIMKISEWVNFGSTDQDRF